MPQACCRWGHGGAGRAQERQGVVRLQREVRMRVTAARTVAPTGMAHGQHAAGMLQMGTWRGGSGARAARGCTTTAGSEDEGDCGENGGPDRDGPRSTCRRHVADGDMAGRVGRKSGKGLYDYSGK